jgi:hypothetical protein
MKLIRISSSEMKSILPKLVTTDQWKAYWGLNKKETLTKIMETSFLSYGGGWLAWFLSFMAGNFISTIVGIALVFNFLYLPIIDANKRNFNVRSGNNFGIFQGRVVR